MKVISVLGARPNFNKYLMISKSFKGEKVREVVIHTGQHSDYEMSQIFFDELELPKPDYFFNVNSGLHGVQTAEILVKTEEVLLREKPDVTLVIGDVNSTVAGALASSKLRIPIAHVEAGPRNRLWLMPEEINRRVSDHLSDTLFAPTKEAYNNLLKENIPREKIFLTGDVIKDTLIYIRKKFRIKTARKNYLLATVHREENTDSRERLKSIFDGLMKCGQKVVLPLHPRTRKRLIEYNMLDKISGSNVELTEPKGYIEFIRLLAGARKVLTDSGGVRREAYILGKPLITLIEEDGIWWPETVECGWNRIVGPNTEKIVDAVENFEPRGMRPRIFGDGHAARGIVDILMKRYG